MVTNYAIPAITQQLLIEGDSISDGTSTALPTSPAWSGNVAVWLTEPGAELVAPGTRVLNNAVSGSQATTVSNSVTTRRDAANSHASWLIPGGPSRNKLIVQIGRNDIREAANAQKNSAALYADVVSIWNATTVGYLQRGWSGVQVANIAATTGAVTTNVSPPGENTLQKRIEGFRALIADEANKTPQPQFLTDTLTNSGQAFDGLLTVLHAYAITEGANQWFYDAALPTDRANATPPGPYDSDDTHLVAEGCRLMATGGDTPQFGYGSVM
jgi:lysophospholipase L1-like esterase